MSDLLSEPLGQFAPISEVDNIPDEFEVPEETHISIPFSIVDATRQEQAQSRFHNYVPKPFENEALLGENASDSDKKWAIETPYAITAVDGRIYIKDKTLINPNYPHANVQVMRIDFDPTTGRITRVFRDGDESLFRLALSSYPDSTVIGKLRDALNVQAASAADIEAKERISADSQKAYELQDELSQRSKENDHILSETLIQTAENNSQIHVVDQAEYSVATHDQMEWLATYGAGPCFIVSMYDPVTRKGALTHLDATVNIERTIDIMASSLFLGKERVTENRPHFQITISGGNMNSALDVAQGYAKIKELQKRGGLKMDLRVFNVLQNSSESLALNLNTGELRQFVPSPELSSFDSKLATVMATSRAIAGSLTGKPEATFSFPKKK